MQRYLSLDRFFQRRKNSRARNRLGLKRPTRRLCHEHLEDRSLLAALTVANDWDSGDGSLRSAIEFANDNEGPYTIEFDADKLANATITLTSGHLHITDDLTIIGLGADQLTISGDGESRIFLVDDGDDASTITVSISGLSLENGFTNDYGGAIFNREDLTMEDCTLSHNSADSFGGGIYNMNGTLAITDSTFDNNSASSGGGRIYNSNSTLTVTNSLLGANTAQMGPDVVNYGTITATYNVIQDGADSDIVDGENGNQVGTTANPLDPLLDPAGLQDNGGPTQTIALMSGSPALATGNPDLAIDVDGEKLEFDQRGPGFQRIIDEQVDVGALQNQPPVAVDDEATTAADVAVVIDVLANDWDPDGDPLAVIAVTDPASGSAGINADYTIT